jgi:hypothetical protein
MDDAIFRTVFNVFGRFDAPLPCDIGRFFFFFHVIVSSGKNMGKLA